MPWTDETVALTKDLFGRPLRVALGIWIEGRSGDAFYVQEAQRAMATWGGSASGVLKELEAFAKHQLLNRLPDGRRVYYVARPHPLWSVFASMGLALGPAHSDESREGQTN